MRTVLIALVVAVAALAAVLVGRTLMVTPYQPPAGAAPASAFDAEKVASRLAETVRFRTISWQDGAPSEDIAASHAAFAALRDWIEVTYPNVAKIMTREVVAEHSLLFTWTGSDPALKPALLMAHSDVVPVVPGSEDKWTHPPFAGIVKDGHIWGRGTMDVKSGIVGMLEAAEHLIAKGHQPKRTIMFAFGHDEEVGGREGNAKIAALLAERKVELEFVNDEGGMITMGVMAGVTAPVALLGVAEKGSVTLELTARSAGGHSSAPVPVGDTAIGRLARAIVRLENSPFESGFDETTRREITLIMPAMPFLARMAAANLWLLEPIVVRTMVANPGSAALVHTTIAPTVIAGGVKDNVLPPEAMARVNFRIHPRDTVTGVEAKVRVALADLAIEVKAAKGGRDPSPISDVDGPQFALIKRAVEAVRPGVIVVPHLVGGGTDSRHYFGLTKNVFRMIPNEVTPEDLERFHGKDERISVESMRRIADYYLTLMTAME
jgi:carboxypeptidase PM20D1